MLLGIVNKIYSIFYALLFVVDDNGQTVDKTSADTYITIRYYISEISEEIIW